MFIEKVLAYVHAQLKSLNYFFGYNVVLLLQ